MNHGPLFPIFGEDFSFHEEFAAVFCDFARLSLRDHGAGAQARRRAGAQARRAGTGTPGPA
jgi:hypothetical protein